MPEQHDRLTGPLRPLELATASVLAGLAVVLTVVGYFLPHIGAVAAFAVVPLGVVAHHHRLRALGAATFAAATLSFLVGGTGTVISIVECAAIGGLVGTAKRRGWGPGGVAIGVMVIGPAFAGLSVGLLALFGSLRKLTLKQIVNVWHGVRKLIDLVIIILRSLGHLVGHLVHIDLGFSLPRNHSKLLPLDRLVVSGVKHWWLLVAAFAILATIWFAMLGWVFLGAVLERLDWIRAQDRLDLEPETASIGPLSAELVNVGYRYPGVETDAVSGVNLTVRAGEMVALVGDNGSGKSTLTRLLAGRRPSVGEVIRPGSAGLGQPDGTALVMQHPESQVLGVRVADDVVWGLPSSVPVDIDALLESVGLAGMDERETSGLSGGELQRLAVAAALARHPRLLLSDESTAMVDEDGRRDLTELLRRLPAERGMAVVHVTHRPEEAAVADRRYRMVAGELRADEPSADIAGPVPRPHSDVEVPMPARIEFAGVTHIYGVGTPWAGTALEDVNLAIEPGEGVLIVGGNGSGKSTLAWILAGILRPTYGSCRLGDEPVYQHIGSVGLAFQHARLQLQRATVGRDLIAAGAADGDAARAALSAVGLDMAGFDERRVDSLSGGEQRRVAIAGILARRPSVLVLDEPLAGLDHPSREGLIDLLAGLRRDHSMTVVVISHDLHGMERVCDRVVRLDGGRIVDDTTTVVPNL